MTAIKKDYLKEARKLVTLIDEMKLTKKNWLFFSSMKAHVKLNEFISEKQIFWLRDIKDRQLESNSVRDQHEEIEDKENET